MGKPWVSWKQAGKNTEPGSTDRPGDAMYTVLRERIDLFTRPNRHHDRTVSRASQSARIFHEPREEPPPHEAEIISTWRHRC